MSREGLLAFILVLVIAPWALLILVAILRGYSIRLDRNGRHRRDGGDDEA